MVLLRNLTIYEINLQNLTLFSAETPFCHFCAGNDGNKLREKYHGSSYGKEVD
jgi:hypothetical protein